MKKTILLTLLCLLGMGETFAQFNLWTEKRSYSWDSLSASWDLRFRDFATYDSTDKLLETRT